LQLSISKKGGTTSPQPKRRLHFLFSVALFATLGGLVLYDVADRHGFAWHLLQLPAFFSLLLMAAVGVLTGIATDTFFCWFRQLSKVRDQVSNYQEVAGHFLGLVGIIYAVVVGFVVVTAWQEYDHTAELSLREEQDVTSIFWTVYTYAPYARKQVAYIREQLEVYAFDMQGEWKQMQDDQKLCPDLYTCKPSASFFVTHGAAELETLINYLPVRSFDDLALKYKARAQVTDLIAARDHRRHHYDERGLDPSLWLVFAFGAIIILALSYSSGNLDPTSQRVRTCAFCAMIFLMLTLAVIFENPFTGSQRLRFASSDWCRIYNDFHIEQHTPPTKCS
jgi:hypothetical protein